MARTRERPKVGESLAAYLLLAPAMALFAWFSFYPFYRLIHYALYRQTTSGTAERYEGGSMNMAGFIGLNASLELLLRYGQEAIGRRVLEITDLACRRLAGSIWYWALSPNCGGLSAASLKGP